MKAILGDLSDLVPFEHFIPRAQLMVKSYRWGGVELKSHRTLDFLLLWVRDWDWVLGGQGLGIDKSQTQTYKLWVTTYNLIL